eukprot:3225590-Alexandrium_andersonii.AAC.1
MAARLPPGLARMAEAAMAENSGGIASRSTLQRLRLALDVATMAQTRLSRTPSDNTPNPLSGVRVAWTDSSPQVKHDWLLTQHHFIPLPSLLLVVQCAKDLACDSQRRLRNNEGAGDFADLGNPGSLREGYLNSNARQDMTKDLVSNVH